MTWNMTEYSAEEMKSMLLVWQEWWNSIGFKWYIETESPQKEKPPFLVASSEHFQKWILEND